MQFQSALMGVNFRGKEVSDLVRSFDSDTSLRLERDPDNEYDANAIKVFNDDTWVGFVAKEVAEELAPLMDRGCDTDVKIVGFLNDIKPLIEIDVFIEDNEEYDDSEADENDGA